MKRYYTIIKYKKNQYKLQDGTIHLYPYRVSYAKQIYAN